MLEQLYNRRDVAEAVRLSERTISRKIADGTFPAPIKKTSRKRLWTRKQIEDWVHGDGGLGGGGTA